MIRNDLLLQFAGRVECAILSLYAKINFLLIFRVKFYSFIGEYYGSILVNLHYFSVSSALAHNFGGQNRESLFLFMYQKALRFSSKEKDTPWLTCPSLRGWSVYGNRRTTPCDSARSELLHPHRAYSVFVYSLIILPLSAA